MKSVLIVEDDITYGMMLKTWLAKKGFVVNSASSIARAQKLIETEEPDLILSDLRLPDRDGLDLLRWLGQKELFIPLIIMTGYADIQSAVMAMKEGASDYIAKPVNPEELLKKMEEALKSAPKRKTATESVGATPVSAKAERAVAADLKPAAAAWSEYLEGESEADLIRLEDAIVDAFIFRNDPLMGKSIDQCPFHRQDIDGPFRMAAESGGN